MDLAEVMQELADRASTIEELRCAAYPADKITPPWFEIELPDRINFDGTYGRGMDSVTLTGNLMVGRSDSRSSVEALVPYVLGSGAKSIKEVLETGNYTAMDTVHIPECAFVDFPVAQVMYRGAQFTIQITGRGE